MKTQQEQLLSRMGQGAGKTARSAPEKLPKPWVSPAEFERKIRREKFLKGLPEVMKNHAG